MIELHKFKNAIMICQMINHDYYRVIVRNDGTVQYQVNRWSRCEWENIENSLVCDLLFQKVIGMEVRRKKAPYKPCKAS